MQNSKVLPNTSVTVVTIVFGDRWHLLKQTLDSLVGDSHIKTIVIVDNNSKNQASMDVYAGQHQNKIVILRQAENLGFSGAIAKGLTYARDTDCGYVLVMDDDCVLEEGGISMFLDNYKYFPNNRVVLIGNRVDVPGVTNAFYRKSIDSQMPTGTIFEVFSFKKVASLIKLILGFHNTAQGPMLPIFPTQAFVTGGSFLPIEAVREVDVPDASLFIYGEDLDYAWRIKKAGYLSYQCNKPIIRDIDLTFGKEGDHIWGLFEERTADYKVYYRMRNSVIISRRNTYQSKPVLLLNVLVWFTGLFILGFFKHSSWKTYFYRVKVIIQAVKDGYDHPNTHRPAYINVPK